MDTEIEEVKQEIRKVQQQIDDAEGQLTKAATEADVAYWRKEEEQLRKKEEQMREEELILREKELLLLRGADKSGQEYGLPEDQAKVIAELAAFLLEEKERKETIRIPCVSQTAWMEVQQKACLKIVWASEAEMESTHRSDLPAFGWDDRIEKAQADRYIPHLNKITKSRVWTVIDAANKFPNLLSCDLYDRHFTGTTDVAWVERRAALSWPQTGLRCIFGLKKMISSGAGHYQALISLLCASIHSQYKPFVVLTDLVDLWALYWVDGSSIYGHILIQGQLPLDT